MFYTCSTAKIERHIHAFRSHLLMYASTYVYIYKCIHMHECMHMHTCMHVRAPNVECAWHAVTVSREDDLDAKHLKRTIIKKLLNIFCGIFFIQVSSGIND